MHLADSKRILKSNIADSCLMKLATLKERFRNSEMLEKAQQEAK